MRLFAGIALALLAALSPQDPAPVVLPQTGNPPLAAPAKPYCYYTLRCANGSFWFQTKAPITAKGDFTPVKGSLLYKNAVKTVTFDPTAPLGCHIWATTEDGTKLFWLLDDPTKLTVAGDHKTSVGREGTLSVTIKP